MSRPSLEKQNDATLDEWLTFEGHFKMVLRELNGAFGLLSKLKNCYYEML